MIGSETPDDGLDVRRRRTHFRCWHRGMREMDLILGRFSDANIKSLDEHELDLLDALMEEQDRDIFSWLTGEVQVPAGADTPFFRKLAAFTGATPR
jgi:antitoxin CptB